LGPLHFREVIIPSSSQYIRDVNPAGAFCRTLSHNLPSMVAYTYLQPSLTAPPTRSRAWLEDDHDRPKYGLPETIEFSGKQVAADAGSPPPMVPGVLDAASGVAKLLYETMKYNSTYGIIPGSGEDLKIRRGLYAEVLGLTDSLPAHLRSNSNFTPQTCILR
jgi:hypothetical protein